MSTTTPQEAWRCATCRTVHEAYSTAEVCCLPTRVWVCGTCGRDFDEADYWQESDAKAEAAACCAEEGAAGNESNFVTNAETEANKGK